MSINFRALSPFGVEAVGFKAADMACEDVEALKRAIASNGFVTIRRQQASDADFVAFLKRLGPVTFTVGETPVPHQPDLNIVSNVGRTCPPRSVFHTDTSYIAQPPAFTALRVVTVPRAGGETLLCDQYRAYETLPSSVKQKLARTKVLHAVTGLTLSEGQESQSWHPLFRRHPLSGRIALYLSTPERCLAISERVPDESQRILRLLYRHSIRASRLYRHRWQPGDIIVWDNRCTMHRADHSNVIGDRVLHRGLVSGGIPLGLQD